MDTCNIIFGVLFLALASPASAVGERYMLPKAAEVALQAAPDATARGTFTLTGKVKALASDLPQAVISFKLPANVEPLGDVPERKETVAKGKEVALTVKVKLKDPDKEAMIGFAVSYDYPVDFWLDYVSANQKGYPSLELRDLLMNELVEMKGKTATLSQVLILEGVAK